MARINTPIRGEAVKTHEGGDAIKASKLKELRRSVMTAMLWESTFYEGGADHAKRLEGLIAAINPKDVAALAIEARDRMYLRHVPLYLMRQLAKIKGNGPLVADTLSHVIQRPDELGEYLAMYWKGNKELPLSAGSKRGLARAFAKFNEYQLAKYDRDGAFKLRDVLRLVHAKPANTEQAALWKKVIDRTLETPDTGEVALSAGGNKKDVFERLLAERKLGGLAFLRNLRNMIEAGVSPDLIRQRFAGKMDKVLPFRYIAAARYAMPYAQDINDAMLRAVANEAKLGGSTAVLVDVSGSMDAALSAKSEMTRMDAAAGLAVLVREVSNNCRTFTFSDRLVEVANYRGLPLVNGIIKSQPHSSTYLGRAVEHLAQQANFDRLIVVTDEQSHDRLVFPANVKQGYVINVASYKNGVGYGKWIHIDGWSERVLDFMREVELDNQDHSG